MKGTFDLEIHDSRSATIRTRYRKGLLLLLILILIGAIIYFFVPKIMKLPTPAKKSEPEVEQQVIKEQIIKSISIPNIEDLKPIQHPTTLQKE
jgi:hypothetical protein